MTSQFGKLLKRFRKQSLLDRVVVSAFVIASVIYGGTKSPTNNPPVYSADFAWANQELNKESKK